MSNPQAAIKKLKRPPAIHNWVRNIKLRTDDTAQSLFEMAVNGPRHSLKPVNDIIRNVVVDQISDAQAFHCLLAIKNAVARAQGRQILTAILPYIRERGWTGVQVFRDTQEFYKVGRGVSVPVRPTFVINDNGVLRLYFVICWAKMDLSEYQKRILTTMVREAILTLEEFQDAEAVFLCVPRYNFSKTERYVREWKVSDYGVLLDDEKRALFERYGNALDLAEKMILEALG